MRLNAVTALVLDSIRLKSGTFYKYKFTYTDAASPEFNNNIDAIFAVYLYLSKLAK